MTLLDLCFGIPAQRLRTQRLEHVAYETPEITLSLKNLPVYADPTAADALVQDPRNVDVVWRTIDGAPWEGKALLADVISAHQDFSWEFIAPEGGEVKFHFRIHVEMSRGRCRKLLRRSIHQALIERGVQMRRIDPHR